MAEPKSKRMKPQKRYIFLGRFEVLSMISIYASSKQEAQAQADKYHRTDHFRGYGGERVLRVETVSMEPTDSIRMRVPARLTFNYGFVDCALNDWSLSSRFVLSLEIFPEDIQAAIKQGETDFTVEATITANSRAELDLDHWERVPAR
jgi:hypothetical protein